MNSFEARANSDGRDMRFDIYSRFQLEVRREIDSWEVYRHELGKRVRVVDIVIPATLVAEEIATWLDDIYHEFSGPGQQVERLS
ncbi:MAG: hypothetical protein M3R60_18675 [Pseudomonadota bacterium]|nr:hypothetical protein [Pseudomonadota bacterium]